MPLARLEESAGRILQLKEDLGLFENPLPDPNSPLLGTVGSRDDRDAALELARESVVLLQNRYGRESVPRSQVCRTDAAAGRMHDIEEWAGGGA